MCAGGTEVVREREKGEGRWERRETACPRDGVLETEDVGVTEAAAGVSERAEADRAQSSTRCLVNLHGLDI